MARGGHPGRSREALLRELGRLRRRAEAAEAALHAAAAREDQLRAEREQLGESLSSLEVALERHADLYDQAPIGYTTIDDRGMVREINRAACDLTRMQRTQALGLPFRCFVLLVDRSIMTRHLRTCRREGAATSRLRLRRRDGAAIPVEIVSHRASGDPACYPTAIVDLSERARAAVERRGLLATERTLRHDVATNDMFIAVVSHELRAPLAPLLALVRSLDLWRAGGAGAQAPDLARIADIIRRNVTMESRLIDDLLDATRIAHGKMLVERAATDLHAIVREVVDALGVETAGKGPPVAVTLAARSPFVDGDATRLRQLVWNLVKNAIKFTPAHGRVSLQSWNRGPSLVLEIADSGIGMTRQALGRLFTPFEQVHERRIDRDGEGGGLGLGLAICRGIVELHGGEIRASSPGLGCGSCFTVEIPSLRALDVPRPLPSRRRSEAAPARLGRLRAAPRILVVEDNGDMADAMELGLRGSGYQVVVAKSARAALEADVGGVDVVVSDLKLPDGSGRDLVRTLRRRADVKAIAVSGLGSTNADRVRRDAVFFAHLTKPFEMEALTATIERALAGSRTPDA